MYLKMRERRKWRKIQDKRKEVRGILGKHMTNMRSLTNGGGERLTDNIGFLSSSS